MLRSLTLRSWLKSLARRFRPHPLAPIRRPRPRLALEEFEVRVVPAVKTWALATGGDWTVAANWGGTVPANNDSVVIPDLAGAQTITFPTGTLSVAGITSAEALSVTGGSLTNTGNLSGAGTLTVAGGTVTFGGTNWTNTAGLALTSGAIHLSGSLVLNATMPIGSASGAVTAGVWADNSLAVSTT